VRGVDKAAFTDGNVAMLSGEFHLNAAPTNAMRRQIDALTQRKFEPFWTGQEGPQQVIATARGLYQQLLDRPRPGHK
jgi:hypothetical protein